MTRVTQEQLDAAGAELAEARAALPAFVSDQDPLTAAMNVDHLQRLAVTESGQRLRLALQRLRELENLDGLQRAAIAAHETAMTAMADRMAAMGGELEKSRSRLRQAVEKGTLSQVADAAKAHDALIRALVAELRDAGLSIEAHGHQFEVGAMEPAGNSGLRLPDGRYWHTIDSFLLTRWYDVAHTAATFGADHPYVIHARRQYRLALLDDRPDGLLDGVKVPKPGASVSPWAVWPGRPNITDPMITGDLDDAHARLVEAQVARIPDTPENRRRREQMRRDLSHELENFQFAVPTAGFFPGDSKGF